MRDEIPDITMITEAAKRLSGHVRKTPLFNSPILDDVAGRRVFVKIEALQHTGSFKYRGAYNAVSSLSQSARKNGVLAFSSGNHAQGVALAARQHRVPAVIVMPADAPQIKISNTKALGAEVVFYDRVLETREEVAARILTKRPLSLIKPFDDPRVIAGQATTGLEIAQQAAELGIDASEVLVCCGGGGLTAGIALALEAKAPELVVRPVEPEGFDDVTRSLQSGRREKNIKTSGSICDAILTPMPGELTFPILKRLCGPGIVMSDAACLQAMAVAWERLKIVLEPGGAIALAAALFRPEEISRTDVIVVASGGNVDRAMFQNALQAGGISLTPDDTSP